MNHILFGLKSQFFQLLNLTGLPQSLIARSGWRIILAFHRVVPPYKASELGLHPSLFITPETFRSLLSSMKEIGSFVDIYSLLSSAPSGTSFSVTFDDGWIDTYTIAYPVLKELNIPFSIFIATSLIDNGSMNWTEEIVAQYVRLLNKAPEKAMRALVRLTPQNSAGETDIYQIIERLKELPRKIRDHHIENFYNELANKKPIEGEMLSWAQIKELREGGVIVGSHTHSHGILSDLKKEQVAEELLQSKKILHERLACDSNIFCYPNGRYKKENEELFRFLGYSYGLILDDKRVHKNDPPFFIPRFLVYEDIVPILYFRFLTEHK